MKNQKITKAILLFLFIVILLLQSCVTTDKVTNSKIIQKRKYNKGFYVDLFSSKKTKSIKNNNEKQLVMNTIDLPDNNTKEPTESYFLNDENNNMPEIKDILLASTKNPVIYPTIKEHSKIVIKNKTVQAKPKNNLIEKEYKTEEKKLNTLKPLPVDDKTKINFFVIIGFILLLIGLIILLLYFSYPILLLLVSSLFFLIPASVFSIIGFIKTKKANRFKKIINMVISVLSFLAAEFVVIFYYWLLYLSIINEGCL